MRINCLVFAIGLLLMLVQVKAQQRLLMARNISQAFAQQTRNANGQPGKNYWQNRADYTLDIHFNPATRLVSGVVDIRYENNSPDTLKSLLFKLCTELYKAGAIRNIPVSPQDIGNGMSIERLSVNGMPQDVSKLNIEGTNMTLMVQPLVPHGQMTIHIAYSYTLNKGSHIRTGEVDEGSYFIAYSFPRITVYDDVDGWNKNEYVGTNEFYNDFCHFDARITVPQHYAVWATGNLLNADEVYTPTIAKRLRKAEAQDDTLTVISEQDIARSNVTAAKPVNTFHFEANDVTDFVFALSNHYVWKAASLVVDSSAMRRTRVDAVYNPAHKEDYDEVVVEARKAVEGMSFYFPKWPYPYAHETVFDGLDKMEYPMMVNDTPEKGKYASFSLTAHEIFHTMFPFYMGINETKYGWMDEGWATIGQWLLTPTYIPGMVDPYVMESYNHAAGLEIDLPIMTPTTQLQGIYYEKETAFALNSYSKPGLGYLYIKDLLGDELFFKALHHYIASWHGKHPLPYDFFNCFNVASSKNLDWFWKAWFFDGGYPDLKIAAVKPGKITVVSKGSKPVPVHLTVHFADGSMEKIHRTVAVWEKGGSAVDVSTKTGKAIVKVELGEFYDADIDKRDNVWVK